MKTEDNQLLVHEASTGADESMGAVGHPDVDIQSTSQRRQRKRLHDGMTSEYSFNYL